MVICVLRPILQLVFAEYFSSCYSSFPTSSSFSSVDIECSDYLSTFTVCIDDVLEAIKELKPKLSTGIDGIPSFIIKGCCSIFAPVLMHIFNLSLAQGYFPKLWKFSAVVPILNLVILHWLTITGRCHGYVDLQKCLKK
uniref:Putative reverse transcriptase n=1 Tax=Ixodes ricinus TaxID=34613 RepID=A0A0K8RBH5_IXORI